MPPATAAASTAAMLPPFRWAKAPEARPTNTATTAKRCCRGAAAIAATLACSSAGVSAPVPSRRSSAPSRQALMPSGPTWWTSVRCSSERRAVAIRLLTVMATAKSSMPSRGASRFMASRTRNAESPERSMRPPKRSRASSASARVGGLLTRFAGAGLGRLGADALQQGGVLLQVLAIGWNHLGELGYPMADQLLVEAVLQHVHHDPRRGRGAGRGAEQGDDRGIGRRDDLGAELQRAGAGTVLLDDLHALAGDGKLPVGLLHLGVELAQRLVAMA